MEHVIIGQRGDIMNKKKLFVIVVAVVFVVAAATILGLVFIERPAFSGIEKEQISSVSYFIYYYENNEPVYFPFPEEDIDELLELMQNIKIKGFGTHDRGDYHGGAGFMFKIQMNNGNQIEFSAENPHMKINGKYYNTEYAPANALSQFWYEYVIAGRREYGLPEL